MCRAIFFSIVLTMSLSNCTKDHSASSSCNSCPAISFNHDVIPLFTQNCAISGCHTGQYPAGNVNLDSLVAYAHATKPGTGYVHAGSPSTSILVQQLSVSANQHMPPNAQLSDCQINIISCWVQEGAANN